MGRPPAAKDLGSNAMTSTWPRITISAPPGLRETLNAVAAVEGRPLWRIIADAVALYVRNLPVEDRRLIDGLAARAKAKATK